MQSNVFIRLVSLVSTALQLTFLADDCSIDVRDGRVIHHGNNGDVNIQPQYVNVNEIEESHAGHQVSLRNTSCRENTQTEII